MLVRFIPSKHFLGPHRRPPHLHHRRGDLRHPLWTRALGVAKEDPVRGEKLREAVLTLQAVIMRLVQMILATPYGILALMTRVGRL